MIGARRAIGLAGVAGALALAASLAACTTQPTGSLSVTPGPNATSSLVPAEEGTPAPSDDPQAPGDAPTDAPAGS